MGNKVPIRTVELAHGGAHELSAISPDSEGKQRYAYSSRPFMAIMTPPMRQRHPKPLGYNIVKSRANQSCVCANQSCIGAPCG